MEKKIGNLLIGGKKENVNPNAFTHLAKIRERDFRGMLMRATYSRLLVLFIISLPLFAMTIVPVTTITMLNDGGEVYFDHQSLDLNYRLIADDPPLPGPDLGLANWTSNRFKNPEFEDWMSVNDIDGWNEVYTGDRYHWAASSPWPVENGSYSGGIQCRDPSGRFEYAEIYKRFLGADADNISLAFDWYVDQNLDPANDIFYLEIVLRDSVDMYNIFYYLNGSITPTANSSLVAHLFRYGPANQWNIFQENITANFLAIEEFPDTIDPTITFEHIYFHIRSEGGSGEYIRAFVDDVLLVNESNGYEWIGYTTENGDFETGDLSNWLFLTNYDAGTVSQSSTAYSGSWSLNITAASLGNSSEASCFDSPEVRLTSSNQANLKFYWNLSLQNPTSNSMSYIRLYCDTGVDMVSVYYMLGYGGVTSPISNISGAILVLHADNYNTQGSWVLFDRNIWNDIGSYFAGDELFVRDFEIEVKASDANTRVVTLVDACSFAAPTINGAGFEDQPDVGQRVRGWTQTHAGLLVTSTAYAGVKAINLTRSAGTTFSRRQSLQWRPLNGSRETYLDVMWRIEDTVSANMVWFQVAVIDGGITRELNYYLNGFTLGLGNSSAEGNFNVTSAGTLNTWIQLHRALARDYEAVFGSLPDVKMDNLYLESNTVGGGRLEILFDDLYIYDDPAPIITNVDRNPTYPDANEVVDITADVMDQDLSTVTLHYQVDSGGWQTLSMTQRSGDTYNGTIAGQVNDTFVEYYVSATDGWGMTTTAMDGTVPWNYTVIDQSPPVVENVGHSPTPVTYLDDALVSADVSDVGSGLASVELYYRYGGSGPFTSSVMTDAGGGQYTANIPSNVYGTIVQYYINASDNMGFETIEDNGGAYYGYTVADNIAPIISNVVRNVTDPEYNETVLVECDVTDDVAGGGSGVDTVTLAYRIDGGSWQYLAMDQYGDHYNITIATYPYGSLIEYNITATDNAANSATDDNSGSMYSYLVMDSYEPILTGLDHSPDPPEYDEDVTIGCDVTDDIDASGVYSVILYYQINQMGPWFQSLMTGVGNHYTAIITQQPYNTRIDYYVWANDTAGNWDVTTTSYFIVVDNTNPILQNVNRDLVIVQYNDTVEVSCTATDPGSGIASVTLYYRNGSGSWYSTLMAYNGTHYVGTIPEHHYNAFVQYYVVATDNAVNSATSGTYNYTVQDDYPPEISDPVHWPIVVTASDSPEVSCIVIDSGSGVSSVLLYYRVNGGSFTPWTMTHMGGGQYNRTIPAQSWGDFVEYYVTAVDYNANSATNDNGGAYYSYNVGDTVGPVIQNVIHTPTSVEIDDSPVISCDVTDIGSGIQSVVLYYRFGGSGLFTSTLMSDAGGGYYTASIPSQVYGTFVQYYINATDNANNWNTDPAVGIYYSYTVVDVTPPAIVNLSQTPLTVVFTDSVVVGCDVTDSSTGVATVMLYYRLNGGLWTSVSMSLTTPDHYEATIGVQPYGTFVEYYVNATDNDNNWAIDDDGGLNYSYTVGDNTDPVISNVGQNPVQVEDTDSPLVGCDVTDTGSGLNTVELVYRLNGGLWIYVAMTPTGDHFEANIPVQIFGTFVEYYVNATDNAGNWVIDDNGGLNYSYTVSDVTGPIISNITQTPPSVNYTQTPLIECEAVDAGSAISKVELYYRVNGAAWIILLMTHTTGDYYEVNIPAQLGTSFVEYYVNATDNAGNWVIDDNGGLNYSYTVSDAIDPIITAVDTAPSSVEYSATPTVGCDASDVGSGILSVRLFYRVDAGTWITLTMSFVSGVHYEVTISAQVWQSQIDYYFNITDNAGNWLVDDNTGSYYSYSIVDTTNPMVSVTEPEDQAVLAAIVSIVISASDPGSGITRIEIAINGTKIAELTSSPYSYSWNTTQIIDGTYTIIITAFDNAGNQASDSIEVIVLNNPIIQPPIPGFPIAAIALAIIAALGIGIYYRRRQPH